MGDETIIKDNVKDRERKEQIERGGGGGISLDNVRRELVTDVE